MCACKQGTCLGNCRCGCTHTPPSPRREWKPKPGDLFAGSDGTRYYAIEVTENTRTAWRDGFHAIREDGNGYPVAAIPDARPLVVIDPEDREQVERLAVAYIATWKGASSTETTEGITTRQMQAALREFANPTPPRPEEPTGLGAVVENGEGRRWVRWTTQSVDNSWTTADGLEAMALSKDCAWSDIPAPVRVLSDGVGEVD